MVITRATKDHLKSIVLLAKEWAMILGYTVSESDIWSDMDRMIQNGVVYLAIDGDQVAGMMSGLCYTVFWTGEKIAEEHWFFVHPHFQRKGIGAILEQAFRGWASTRNCSAVIITPNRYGDVDPKGVADYLEKRGYEVHGYRMKRSLNVLKQDIAAVEHTASECH